MSNNESVNNDKQNLRNNRLNQRHCLQHVGVGPFLPSSSWHWGNVDVSVMIMIILISGGTDGICDGSVGTGAVGVGIGLKQPRDSNC